MSETNSKIKVLLVDPHPVVRIGLRCILEGDEIEIIGAIGTGGALSTIEETQPDVVIMELKKDSRREIYEILNKYPSARILIFTGYHHTPVTEAISAGVIGFLMKDSSPAIIKQGVIDVAAGLSPISPELNRELVNGYVKLGRRVESSVLNDRQIKVLAAISAGKTGKEISKQVFISPSTVKREVRDIFNKLGTSDRASSVAEGIRRGLIG